MSNVTQHEGILTHVDEDGNIREMYPEIKTDKTVTLDGKAADAAAVRAMFEELEKCFQSVSDGKALVASAITDKRVPTDATATFEEIANNISQIVLGSGNATTADVLAGKTFTNDDGVEYTGAMPNRGAVSGTLNCGGSYTIPAGYHNGSGKITANSLAAQTSATAGASAITKGYTAWVNGVKITGTRAAPLTQLSGTINTDDLIRGGSSLTGHVTFSTPFDTTPSMRYTNNGSSTAMQRMYLTFSSVSRTGFTYTIYNPNDSSGKDYGKFTWVASA